MINLFSRYKIFFYSINILLIFLYLFPGSVFGWFIYGDKKIQPQITADFVISSNHFIVFILISIIGFLTFEKTEKIRILIMYLISLSIILEILHFIIPLRTFQFSDLFGNLFGVIVVILIRQLLNKYELFKK
jgi:hypothetical protein|tara:strand:- start:365 stop:760 length:396 start_codon:yes stop_codon:yes gene_type:complete